MKSSAMKTSHTGMIIMHARFHMALKKKLKSYEMPMRKTLTQGDDYPGHSPEEKSGQAI